MLCPKQEEEIKKTICDMESIIDRCIISKTNRFYQNDNHVIADLAFNITKLIEEKLKVKKPKHHKINVLALSEYLKNNNFYLSYESDPVLREFIEKLSSYNFFSKMLRVLRDYPDIECLPDVFFKEPITRVVNKFDISERYRSSKNSQMEKITPDKRKNKKQKVEANNFKQNRQTIAFPVIVDQEQTINNLSNIQEDFDHWHEIKKSPVHNLATVFYYKNPLPSFNSSLAVINIDTTGVFSDSEKNPHGLTAAP